MQARAIFEAATAMVNQGVKVFPEIMVPLVGTPQVAMLHSLNLNVACIDVNYIYYLCRDGKQSDIFQTRFNLHMLCLQELKHQVELIHQVAKEVFAETGLTLEYKVGTMIEIPRAALVADEVYIWII